MKTSWLSGLLAIVLVLSSCVEEEPFALRNATPNSTANGQEQPSSCEAACDHVYDECGLLVMQGGATQPKRECVRLCEYEGAFDNKEVCMASAECLEDLDEMIEKCDENEPEPEPDPDPDPDPITGLSQEEHELYVLINDYRVANGLPEIPLSVSLTVVARAHVQDLIDHGSTVLSETCNLHSWSDHGDWTGCCYTSDHAQAQCMWDKPGELTNYPSAGFEISVSGAFSAAGALSSWQGSPGHDDVIMNRGTWEDSTWRAIGVGIEGGYSHVWFGTSNDPDEFPSD